MKPPESVIEQMSEIWIKEFGMSLYVEHLLLNKYRTCYEALEPRITELEKAIPQFRERLQKIRELAT